MAKKSKAVTAAIKLIKKWEGFMPEPYLCPAGVPTIGYGSTFYENGDEVKMTDEKVDKKRAEEILINHVNDVEAQVKRVIKHELNPNQLGALISFTYNLGIGNLKRSTLLIKVNNGPDDQAIETELKRWVKSGGKVLNGLVARRAEESDLYYGRS
jgi:lysozyme